MVILKTLLSTNTSGLTNECYLYQCVKFLNYVILLDRQTIFGLLVTTYVFNNHVGHRQH